MNKFDTLVEKLETSDTTLLEHCKPDEYLGAFNALQGVILRELYDNFLRKTEEYNYGDLENTPMMLMYLRKLKHVLAYLGDNLCKRIPNEKTLKYTGYDVQEWAQELFNYIKHNDI